MDSPGRKTRAAVLVASIVLLLAGCGRTPPEEALRARIATFERAVEERDAGAVMDHLADGFLGNRSIDREAARRMVHGLFLRFRDIGLVVSGLEVELHPLDPARATARAGVAVAGLRGLVPEQGNLYRVESQWRLENGEWLLHRLDWD